MTKLLGVMVLSVMAMAAIVDRPKIYHPSTPISALKSVPLDPAGIASPRGLANPPTSSKCATYGPGKDRWAIKTSILSAFENESSVQSAPTVDAQDIMAAPNVSADDRALQHARLSNDPQKAQLARIGAISYSEGQLLGVHGYIRRIQCEADDGDFHIDLASSASATRCVIVEVPNPYTADLDDFVGPRADEIRKELTKIYEDNKTGRNAMKAVEATFFGQLFYDAYHGGGGGIPSGGGGRGSELDGSNRCATRLWEIHPVVGLKLD